MAAQHTPKQPRTGREKMKPAIRAPPILGKSPSASVSISPTRRSLHRAIAVVGALLNEPGDEAGGEPRAQRAVERLAMTSATGAQIAALNPPTRSVSATA